MLVHPPAAALPVLTRPHRLRRCAAVVTTAALVVGGASVASVVTATPASAQTRTGAVQSAAKYASSHGYKVGIAVIDTRTNAFYGGGSYNSMFASESLIKVFIATRLLLQGRMHGDTAARAYKMITQSDDAIASAFYGSVGGDGLINWMKAHYHVPDLGTPPPYPGWWGSTHVNPTGLAKLYVKLKRDPKVAPWLINAMHHHTTYGSDGFYQAFGLPSATTNVGVKQGWGSDWSGGSNASQNTTGYVNGNRYVVVILGRGPASSYGSRIGSMLTTVARMVLPGGEFPSDRPTVTRLSATSGPAGGGQRLTVYGTNFRNVKNVWFDGTRGKSIKVLSSTALQVTTPLHARDWVNVRVTTSSGYSRFVTPDRYLFEKKPRLTSIDTKTGSTGGLTKVVIKGSTFTRVTAVLFGTARATFSVQSTGQLVATSPRHAAGRVDIRIVTAYGTSPVTAADRFTYGAAPTATALTPSTGPAGTTVKVTGTGFTAASRVSVDNMAVKPVTVAADGTSLTVVMPAHAAGRALVTVTTEFGTTSTLPYTYA